MMKINFMKLAFSMIATFIISLIVSCYPSPVTNNYTLTLPNGTEVLVIEKFTRSWDDDVFEYTFVHKDRVIATSFEWNNAMEINTGQADDTVFFFQKKLICIEHEHNWTSWDVDNEAFFSGFSIKDFQVREKQWIITIETGVKKSLKDDLYTGTLPPLLHIESNDYGKSWSVRENKKVKKRKIA